MNKSRTWRTVTLSMVVAVLAVFLMAFTVSAQSVSSQYAPAVASCSTVPVTNIVTSPTNHLANYKPNKISVKVSTTLSFCITNKTKAKQNVTYMGSTLASVAAGKTVGIRCNTPNNATFSLSSNHKAKLSITCK